jgi:hypothetical protein
MLICSAGFLVSDKNLHQYLQGGDTRETTKINIMLAYRLVVKSE